jgi:hypothetical protein
VRVLVVWEPVLEADREPDRPTLGLISDARASQFWDPGRLVSQAILDSARSDPALLEGRRPELVWDAIAVFRPGARWGETFPRPDFRGHPVVRAIAGAEEAMERLAR